jgi:hypothetical protein
MKRNLFMFFILALAFVLAGAATAWADTLELRDGRVIRGKFMGGTEVTVRMEINGTVQSFPVSQVMALSFSEEGAARMVPADAPPSGEAPQVAAAPAPAPAPQTDSYQKVTVPAGTRILVRMIDSVDSANNRIGDKFRASLEENLEADGVIVAPRGADVIGRLAEAKGAGHMTGHSELKLELTDIRVGDELLPIVTGDYDVAGKNRGGNTAAKTLGGAAIGAVIGALAGGGRGAAIGAGVGGGAGATINIITKGEQVKVPSETMLEFRLDQPLTARPAPARNR